MASLDDHALWLQRLSTAANAFVGIGVGMVILVLVATGLAVTFATRGAMAGNREVVEVLHFVGADDDYIARAFSAGSSGSACAGARSAPGWRSWPSRSPGCWRARPARARPARRSRPCSAPSRSGCAAMPA